MTAWLCCGALALTLALAGTASEASTSVDITTAKRLSVVLLSKGQAQAAHDILSELLRHNPDDPEILITLSRAERALGHSADAVRLARHAFRVSDTESLRFLSARVMAEALAAEGKHTRAQIWLRRAGQEAPSPEAEAIVRRDYDYVRSRNPWSFSFGGAITPTDNANDAPTSDEIVIGGLVFVDPTAQPIPGLEMSFSATATYRLPATQTRQTQFSLSYDMRRVRLGAEAAIINPNLTDDDFSSDRVTLGWAGKFRTSEGKGVFDLSGDVFLDWNGGARSQNGQAVAAGYKWPVAARQSLRLGVEVENLDRIDSPIRSSTTTRLSAAWATRLDNRDSLGLELTLSDTNSDSFAVAHQSTRLHAYYAFAEPVMTAHIGLAADLRTTLFDTPLYSPERRDDLSMSISATATFGELSVFGFAPVVELRRERVHSNISRFDTETTQLSLSIRSTY